MEKLQSITLRLNNKLYGGKNWCYFVITKKFGTSALIEDSTLHIRFILSFSNESQSRQIHYIFMLGKD
jgi:hypothetical protein